MITLKIKAEGDDKEEEITFTNEHLNNFNFVDMLVGDESYTIPVDDLVSIAKAFDEQKKRFK